ncbi:MAG: OsmC family protein [Oceanospirillaceae bacterium]|nr:OsmC family protein [Oceanospirillaceae bacterium]
MTMHATVQWVGDDRFKATTGSGFDVMIDRDLKEGGRPMELLLASLGSCSSVDVMAILRKSRQDVVSCVVEVSGERADAVPAVFTAIHVKFVVTGRNLKEAHVRRAVQLSAEQYCSVSMMLEKGGVEMSHSYEIVEAEA